jgi:hypothetical protein
MGSKGNYKFSAVDSGMIIRLDNLISEVENPPNIK